MDRRVRNLRSASKRSALQPTASHGSSNDMTPFRQGVAAMQMSPAVHNGSWAIPAIPSEHTRKRITELSTVNNFSSKEQPCTPLAAHELDDELENKENQPKHQTFLFQKPMESVETELDYTFEEHLEQEELLYGDEEMENQVLIDHANSHDNLYESEREDDILDEQPLMKSPTVTTFHVTKSTQPIGGILQFLSVVAVVGLIVGLLFDQRKRIFDIVDNFVAVSEQIPTVVDETIEPLVEKLPTIDVKESNSDESVVVEEKDLEIVEKESANVVSVDSRLQMVEIALGQLAEKLQQKENAALSEQRIYGNVQKMIETNLNDYHKRQIGFADYALENTGGRIVHSLTSATYDPFGDEQSSGLLGSLFSFVGIIGNQNNGKRSNPPEMAIRDSMTPGSCWPFAGSKGNLTIQLARAIIPTNFTVEHLMRQQALNQDISSAPNHIKIFGISGEENIQLAELEYLAGDIGKQVFPTQTVLFSPIRRITIQILSNHGNPTYTCLYRFQVHGLVPK